MKFTLSALLVIASFLSWAQNIDSLASPNVWFAADRSQLSPTQWSDVSIFKNHAIGISSSTTPSAYSAFNFNKAIVFDGVDDYLKIPFNLDRLTEFSILAVFQSSDTTERGVWGAEQAILRNSLLTTRRAFGPDTIPDAYGHNEKVSVLNAVFQSWDKTGVAASSSAFIALGSAGTSKNYKPFKGSFAELIIFNRSLTFLEHLQYETYLAIKYGTGLRGRNFISSKEKVLWDVARNGAYGRNIAGIGRDDYFHLYQKQSGSAYDSALLVISATRLANSNADNRAVINDQDFILWGDNGSSLKTKPGLGADSVLSVVQRKWLVTTNGNSANTISTEIYIDTKRLAASPLGYWLVIDRSGRGNFSVDNLEYVNVDRITADGKAVYKIQWDTDHSGTDSFGFAKARSLFGVVRTLKDPSCSDEKAGRIRIDVIAGEAPFQYSLNSRENKISRQGKLTVKTLEQQELLKGDYQLTLRDDANQSLLRNFTLHMPDALYINLGDDQQLSGGNEIVLDVKSQVPDSIPVTYMWESNFGYSSVSSKATITESGIYSVTVTKQSDQCVFTDQIIISGSEQQKLAVFPTILNGGDQYNVSVSLPKSGSVSVQIFDMKGMSQQTMIGENNSEYAFKSTLSNSGMYIVVITTPLGIESRKLMVN